jgi:hypothetical protein
VEIPFFVEMGNGQQPAAEKLLVTAGPSPHYSENAYAMQSLLHSTMKDSFCMSRSDAPYRTGK